MRHNNKYFTFQMIIDITGARSAISFFDAVYIALLVIIINSLTLKSALANISESDSSVDMVRVCDQGSRPQYVNIEIQGVSTSGVIDTGADITITVWVVSYLRRLLKQPN